MEETNRGNASTMTFINRGYCHDGQTLNASRLCNGNQIHTPSSLRDTRAKNANENRTHIEGIREYAQNELEREHPNYRKPSKTNRCNSASGCLIFLTIIFVFAPFAVSAYVFWKHHEIVSSSCPSHSVGSTAITPSMQQSKEKHTELTRLMDDVKDLHEKYQKLQVKARKSQNGSSSSIREERINRRNRTDTNSKAYETSLAKLHELSRKARTDQMGCQSKLNNLNLKIYDINSKLKEATSTGKCVFKMENNSQVDNAKNIRKAQIIEQKDAAVQLVGVTCCSDEYTTSNVSNAILEVTETTGNITYACYCATGQSCNICYWKCGGNSRHRVK